MSTEAWKKIEQAVKLKLTASKDHRFISAAIMAGLKAYHEQFPPRSDASIRRASRRVPRGGGDGPYTPKATPRVILKPPGATS